MPHSVTLHKDPRLLRRLAVFGFVIFFTALGVLLMGDLVWGMPMRGVNGILLALFTLLFGFLTFGSAQAFFGFFIRRGRGDIAILTATLPREKERDAPLARTAILLAIYNEDVTRVFAGLRAIYHSVERTGQLAYFDFFVLSDSTEPDKWVEEEAAWLKLTRELDATSRIFYRKRRLNTNKKAGNIADFCRRWGRNYRYMVPLDADSIMTGGTLVRMAQLMEQNRDVGLIQTAPAPVRAETLFARVQQFSMRLYGPVFLSGLNYWQQSDGNYWGHNAIIRIAPFIQHCALPKLPGKEPFGGKILSHDFVEAALLRRAGWEVWLLPDVGGSYEEGPPTLIDSAKRDRRWCQGNLQHTWLLLGRGLRPVSRLHLFLGVFSYGSSLLWFLFLVMGSLLTIGFSRTGLTWVPVPGWGTSLGINPASQFAILFVLTLIFLFGPKALAVADLLLRPGEVRMFGGVGKVLIGVVCETLFSVVLAPVLMLFHTKFIVTTLLGSGVNWVTQRRGSSERIAWREAFITHKYQTLLGLVWGVLLAWYSPVMLAWMSPVIGGMLLAVPFSALTGYAGLGQWTRRRGWFCSPEEISPPLEIAEIDRELHRAEAEVIAGKIPEGNGLTRAVIDPYVNAIHICLLRESNHRAEGIQIYFEDIRSRLLREGPAALSPREHMAVLSDAESMDWLHREIWRRPASSMAPWWETALQAHRRQLTAA